MMAKAKKPMEIIAEVHEEESKKIFFYAKGPLEPRAWAELWDRKKAKEFVASYLKDAKADSKPFESFRVESHGDSDGDARIMSWGEDSPGADLADYGSQKGLLVELDGKEVFNNLEEIDEDDE